MNRPEASSKEPDLPAATIPRPPPPGQPVEVPIPSGSRCAGGTVVVEPERDEFGGWKPRTVTVVHADSSMQHLAEFPHERWLPHQRSS